MNRNYFLGIVIIALLCLFLIFFSLWREIKTPVVTPPASQSSFAPFKSAIAGVGIVEPSSENVYIGSPVNRIVEKVFVKVDAKVKKGDILFKLEDRDLKADFVAQQAAYKTALARLEKLEAYPRAEDLMAANAAFNGSKAEVDFAKTQYEMTTQLSDPRAISQEEKNRRLYQYQLAESKWHQAQADLDKIKAGAWKPDLEIAQQEALQAKANVDRIKTEIQRTIIRAPIDGTVLQIKVHEGEFPSSDQMRTPILILGNLDELYLRVSINQVDIPFFHPDSQAIAYLQGNSKEQFPLEFVREEPFLVSKHNLTNQITEKVDTRVLQILYRIKKDGFPLYVGQQMDVYIKAKGM